MHDFSNRVRKARLLLAVASSVAFAACGQSLVPNSAPQALAPFAAPATGYKKLYSFTGYPAGAKPTGLSFFSGVLYGTASNGGAHTFGAVFARTASGGARTVYSFAGGLDGATPTGGLTGLGGLLYGTTEEGGSHGDGTVFRVNTDGAENVVHAFSGGTDGAAPILGTLLEVGSALYGATSAGGASNCHFQGSVGCGTIYSLNAQGAEHVLHRFTGKPDGAAPYGTLIAVNGTLYGTTAFGGKYDNGCVFSLSTSGALHVIYSFKGFPDGAEPWAGVVSLNGKLYGTTAFGGAFDYSGTVYSLTLSGTERVLHSFSGYPDGAVPYDGLAAVDNTLYGTTQFGGESGQRCTGKGLEGCGIVFSITPSGTESVIYRFKGDPDGSIPWSPLLARGRTLYGTTVSGGRKGEGSIFSISAGAASR
ncbi:MAG TPA: choice-of-anchor tandem repeat GloVer-containing protein [Candidatus Cybelea sp.]|nr:choice-of-anchor tandem repeat GloVer-containing protein [Candidatus Cybelea sp.]